jgi:hypothetical protein
MENEAATNVEPSSMLAHRSLKNIFRCQQIDLVVIRIY